MRRDGAGVVEGRLLFPTPPTEYIPVGEQAKRATAAADPGSMPQQRNVYFASLPNAFTDDDLHMLASAGGAVTSVRFIPAAHNGSHFTCRGYGFVMYADAATAAAAVTRLHGTYIDGRRIQVRLARLTDADAKAQAQPLASQHHHQIPAQGPVPTYEQTMRSIHPARRCEQALPHASPLQPMMTGMTAGMQPPPVDRFASMMASPPPPHAQPVQSYCLSASSTMEMMPPRQQPAWIAPHDPVQVPHMQSFFNTTIPTTMAPPPQPSFLVHHMLPPQHEQAAIQWALQSPVAAPAPAPVVYYILVPQQQQP